MQGAWSGCGSGMGEGWVVDAAVEWNWGAGWGFGEALGGVVPW